MGSHDRMDGWNVIRANAVLGEGPLWCARTQSLMWIDGNKPQYFRWRWGSEQAESWPLERPPAALARTEDGRLVMAFRARIGVLDAPGSAITDLDMPGLDLGDERFNDAKVDRRGRLWIGTIDRALNRRIGSLYRMDEHGISAVDSGFALSNGLCWSPGGETLYFSESFDRLVHRYHFDMDSGSIHRTGTLASFAGGEPKPDGLTADARGGIWCAVFGAGRIDRYLPDGTLDRSIHLPVSRPTSCMFGGPDLRTLFITTATFGLSEAEKLAEPLAGSVFAIPLDVPGLPEPMLSARCILLRQHPTHPETPPGACHV